LIDVNKDDEVLLRLGDDLIVALAHLQRAVS
jgi:hypothetical protein